MVKTAVNKMDAAVPVIVAILVILICSYFRGALMRMLTWMLTWMLTRMLTETNTTCNDPPRPAMTTCKDDEEQRLRKEHQLFSDGSKDRAGKDRAGKDLTMKKTLPGLVTGCEISLCYKKTTTPFDHLNYFVKFTERSQQWSLGFVSKGEGSLEGKMSLEAIYDNGEFKAENITLVTMEMLERIDHILPANNFSYSLRNSEHIARYIIEGNWLSMQMTTTGTIRKFFQPILKPEHIRQIASPPTDLMAKTSPKDNVPLFNGIEMVKFVNKLEEFKLTDKDYNIVLVGPTGAGKSTMTNLLFNLSVCDTKEGKMTTASVTRKFQVVQGTYKCDDNETIKVNVVDTMGFCDQYVEDDQAVSHLADAILNEKSKIDKVMIVLSETPIANSHKAAIKNLLDKLSYPLYKDSFVFLYNKTETLDHAKKIDLIKAMGEDLNVDINHRIEVVKPSDEEEGLETSTFFRAGKAVGVNPENYGDAESMKTVKFLKSSILPHSASVLQSTKRMGMQEGCSVQ